MSEGLGTPSFSFKGTQILLNLTSGLTEVLTPRKSEPRPQSEVRGFSEMGQNLDGETCKVS